MGFFKGKTATPPPNMERRWAFIFIVSSLAFFFLLAASCNMGLLPSLHAINSIFSVFATRSTHDQTNTLSVESKLTSPPPPPPSATEVPKLAYLVSGSKGDGDRLWRTLRALYHPRNLYVVHLDLESPVEERLELATRITNDPVFAAAANVHVIAKANMVTYRGPTMVANTLHACAILLRKSKDWDWFINLSASDYPLVTQDDMLSVFSHVPRYLNFVEHTSVLGWKEGQRAKPLIMDPGLYMTNKSDVFWVTQRRELPTAFKLFTVPTINGTNSWTEHSTIRTCKLKTLRGIPDGERAKAGSAWMMLSREFVEYCIWGWDNLPRTLLMYYTNFISTPEGYFQTVICNSPEFSHTVVNHDLHYISWDVPPKQHPHTLTIADAQKMVGSNVPFARKFNRNDPILDKIDIELLGRVNGSFVPGGWCGRDKKCTTVYDPTCLSPGPGARRLSKLVNRIVRSKILTLNQCR